MAKGQCLGSLSLMHSVIGVLGCSLPLSGIQELWKGCRSAAGFRLDGEALLCDCVELELSDTFREHLVEAADILCERRG